MLLPFVGTVIVNNTATASITTANFLNIFILTHLFFFLHALRDTNLCKSIYKHRQQAAYNKINEASLFRVLLIRLVPITIAVAIISVLAVFAIFSATLFRHLHARFRTVEVYNRTAQSHAETDGSLPSGVSAPASDHRFKLRHT